MIGAGIKFRSNHFERQAKGLNTINTITPRSADSVGPADGPFTIPIGLSLEGCADRDWDLDRLIVFKES